MKNNCGLIISKENKPPTKGKISILKFSEYYQII